MCSVYVCIYVIGMYLYMSVVHFFGDCVVFVEGDLCIYVYMCMNMCMCPIFTFVGMDVHVCICVCCM